MNRHFRPSTVVTILLLLLFGTTACKQNRNQTQTPNPEWLTGSNIIYFSNPGTPDNRFSQVLNAIPELLRSGVKIVHVAIPDDDEFWTEKSENSTKQLRKLADSLHHNNIRLMTDLPVKRCTPDNSSRMIVKADVDAFYVPDSEANLSYEWTKLQHTADSLKSDFVFATGKQASSSQTIFTLSTQDEYPALITRIGRKQLKASALISLFEKEAKTLGQNDVRIYTSPFSKTYKDSEERSLQMITLAFIYTLPGIVQLSEQNLTDTQADSTFIHLIQDMNRLKTGNKGLWSMKFKDSFMGLRNTAPDAIVSYVRFHKKTQVLCIFNFSHAKQTFSITDMLNGNFSVYSGKNINVVYNKDITLPPMSYTLQTCMN